MLVIGSVKGTVSYCNAKCGKILEAILKEENILTINSLVAKTRQDGVRREDVRKELIVAHDTLARNCWRPKHWGDIPKSA